MLMVGSRVERLQAMARTLAVTGKYEDSGAVTRYLIFDGHPDAIEVFVDPAFAREIDRLCRSNRKKAHI